MSTVNQLGKYQPYPEYKDSGAEWFGNIPNDWCIVKVGHLTTKIGSGKTPSGGATTYVDDGITFLRSQNIYDDGLRLDDVVYISHDVDAEMAYSRVKPMDILINITGASIGRTTIVPVNIGSANVNQHVCIVRLHDLSLARFIAWAMKSQPTKCQIGNAQTGAAREGLNFEQVANILLCLPQRNYSAHISDFLDYETARIEQLIAKQQQLIELLKEKRQAVISHAVTKGLNPNAPMKDSGIEWLGQVPEHWVIKKISWDFSAQKGRNGQILTKEYCGQNQGSYPVYSGQTENDGVMGYISTHEFDFGSEGCLFSTTVGAKAMTLSLLKGKFSLSQNCMIITKKPQSHFNIEFSFFHFQPLFRYERGLIPEHMQASFRMEDLYQYSVAAPSIEEQICIVSHIKNETLRIDKLIQLSTESILYAQERRTALISAAVTGKIDLRGWQPPKSEVAS